jgi:anti-sigma regulatory factor (Ser/Thr protein kinase)
MPLARHRFAFSPHYAQVATYLDELEAVLPSDFQTDDNRILLAEALTNAIVHGALGIPSSLRQMDRLQELFAEIELSEQRSAVDLLVTATVTIGSSGSVEVLICDRGKGFDWRRTTKRAGRGLGIIASLTRDVRWNESGNCVCLRLKPEA